MTTNTVTIETLEEMLETILKIRVRFVYRYAKVNSFNA